MELEPAWVSNTRMRDEEIEETATLNLKKVVATVWGALGLGLLGCMGLGQLGTSWWTLDLLNHFYLQYAGIAVVGAALGFFLRAPTATALFILAAGISAFQLAPLFMAPAEPTRQGPVALRVLALNVLTTNRDHARAADWIVSEDADVLVLMETSERWVERLARPLAGYDRLDTATIRDDNFGLSVYVRRGLGVGDVRVMETAQSIPWIDAEITKESQRFHLIAIHTLPPVGQNGANRRGEQLVALGEHVDDLEGPVVVAGDLNATLWSHDLIQVLDGERLRPACLGFGPQGSWPSGLWFTGMILIDHVLVSEEVTIKDHRIGVDVGSDHRGLVVDLRL